MGIFRRSLPILVSWVVIFIIGILPSLGVPIRNISLYYGSLIFVTLLAGSFILLLNAVQYPVSERREIDLRVVHFSLRIALTLGIGAVVIAVLFLLAVFGIVPLFGTPY